MQYDPHSRSKQEVLSTIVRCVTNPLIQLSCKVTNLNKLSANQLICIGKNLVFCLLDEIGNLWETFFISVVISISYTAPLETFN